MARGSRPNRATHDRDGDVKMGSASVLSGRRANGISKNQNVQSSTRVARPRVEAPGRRELMPRRPGREDIRMREAPSGPRENREMLVELKITGWEKSKASGDADGGAASLIKWMEKRAGIKMGSRARSLKVKKSRISGPDEMVIKVASSDANAFARLDRYQWAGVVVRIARLDAPASSIVQTAAQADAENTKRMLLSVLERRYEFKSKFLDLSALRADEELQKQDIFAKTSTTHKFFPAMMRVLELSFDSKTARDEAVSSVSLANNDLTDVSLVTSLSQTLPKLVNLDLSGNKFENISALGNWRRCFPDLSHLIVTGNPMESKDPEYWKTAMNWWPKLRFLNGLPVRDDQGMSLAVMPYELMAQLSVKTNMVPSYSRLCLEQTNWDLEKALDAFHNVKHTLPGEAFTST